MKTIIYFLMALLICTTIVSAEVQTLPALKINTCINLPQTCANCTYVNLTKITKPDHTIVTINSLMTKSGEHYNYTFCDTSLIGDYVVETCQDPDGEKVCVNYNFPVTPSGYEDLLGFYIIIFILGFAILGFAFYIKDGWIAILGGFLLGLDGILIILWGIDFIRNQTTTFGIGIILIGFSAYVMINSGLEMMND